MEQNEKREISLIDLWHIFTKNFLKLIIIAVIIAIICGAWGGFANYKNYTYSSKLEFKVTPTDETDSLLYDLRSEVFAEKLLLNENGLPDKSLCNTSDYDAAVEAINAFTLARENKIQIKKELDKISTSAIELQKKYYDEEYDRVAELLKIYKTSYSESISSDENHKAMITKLESQLKEIDANRTEFLNGEYNPVMLNKAELQDKLSLASIELEEARKTKYELVEKVLASWRTDEEIQNSIITIKNSVTYEYQIDSNDKNATTNKGYIIITVTVDGDKDMANFIVDALKTHVSGYIINHIEESTSEIDVECTLISSLNESGNRMHSAIKQAVIYAVISAIATVVVVYIVLVFRWFLATEEKSKNERGAENKTEE